MLKDHFFTLNEVANSETGKTFHVSFNALHPIFQAHFAGNPVMPGACIVQMIKELAEDYINTPLFISSVKKMKFLKVIDPLKNPEVTVQLTFTPIETGVISIFSVISCGDDIFTKAILILNPI